MPQRHIEDDHQRTFFVWADLQTLPKRFNLPPEYKLGHFTYAVPNGGKRNRVTAAIMKGLGVRAGVPDIEITLSASGYSGLHIEMKKPIVKGQSKPTVSPAQKEWLHRLNMIGRKAVVCYGYTEAREVATAYLQDELE